MNKKLLLSILFIGFNLNVESKIDLKKIANEVKSKIQKAPAKAAAIALGTIVAVSGIASIFLNKTKLEELIYFYDKLLDTIAETNIEEKVAEFGSLSQGKRELKLEDVVLFEIDKTQTSDNLKKKLVKITCKIAEHKEIKDLYLDLGSKMIVQLKDNKTMPMNFAKDSEPKKTYLVKTLSELADPVDQKISHWSKHKNKYIAGGGIAATIAVGGLGYYYGCYLPAAAEAESAAEKARVEAAEKMKKDLDTECLRNGKDSNTCLQAHQDLAKLCPAGSTNLSCENAHENLANTQALVALEETRYQACSVDSNSLKCLRAKKAQACSVDSNSLKCLKAKKAQACSSGSSRACGEAYDRLAQEAARIPVNNGTADAKAAEAKAQRVAADDEILRLTGLVCQRDPTSEVCHKRHPGSLPTSIKTEDEKLCNNGNLESCIKIRRYHCHSGHSCLTESCRKATINVLKGSKNQACSSDNKSLTCLKEIKNLACASFTFPRTIDYSIKECVQARKELICERDGRTSKDCEAVSQSLASFSGSIKFINTWYAPFLDQEIIANCDNNDDKCMLQLLILRDRCTPLSKIPFCISYSAKHYNNNTSDDIETCLTKDFDPKDSVCIDLMRLRAFYLNSQRSGFCNNKFSLPQCIDNVMERQNVESYLARAFPDDGDRRFSLFREDGHCQDYKSDFNREHEMAKDFFNENKNKLYYPIISKLMTYSIFNTCLSKILPYNIIDNIKIIIAYKMDLNLLPS